MVIQPLLLVSNSILLAPCLPLALGIKLFVYGLTMWKVGALISKPTLLLFEVLISGLYLSVNAMVCPSIGLKLFWTVQIVLDVYKLFWLGPYCFGRVQIILVRFKLDFSGLIFIIWTCPKWFEPNQNKFGPSKMIGTRPKWFWKDKALMVCRTGNLWRFWRIPSWS